MMQLTCHALLRFITVAYYSSPTHTPNRTNNIFSLKLNPTQLTKLVHSATKSRDVWQEIMHIASKYWFFFWMHCCRTAYYKVVRTLLTVDSTNISFMLTSSPLIHVFCDKVLSKSIIQNSVREYLLLWSLMYRIHEQILYEPFSKCVYKVKVRLFI